MNPATDTGKRRLPHFIRSKFTEFYVAETRDHEQLSALIQSYTQRQPDAAAANVPRASRVEEIEFANNIANFYISTTHKFPRKFR